MSDARIEKLIGMSESYYLPAGFHSPEHRERVIEEAQHLTSVAIRSNLQPNCDVVNLGAAWHDAGTAICPDDFEVKGEEGWRPAKHSEEVAAELFRRAAERVNVPINLARGVCRAILSTNPGIPPKSVEAKIVAAADLHGVGFDNFNDFVANTRSLWNESQWRNGQTSDWPDFVRGSINYLGLFTGRKIQLTQEFFDTARRSAWHVGAVNNIVGLARNALGDIQTVLETDEESPNCLLLRIIQQSDNQQVGEMKATIPVSGKSLSIPDGIVNELRIKGRLSSLPWPISETERVLGGTGLITTHPIEE